MPCAPALKYNLTLIRRYNMSRTYVCVNQWENSYCMKGKHTHY